VGQSFLSLFVPWPLMNRASSELGYERLIAAVNDRNCKGLPIDMNLRSQKEISPLRSLFRVRK